MFKNTREPAKVSGCFCFLYGISDYTPCLKFLPINFSNLTVFIDLVCGRGMALVDRLRKPHHLDIG